MSKARFGKDSRRLQAVVRVLQQERKVAIPSLAFCWHAHYASSMSSLRSGQTSSNLSEAAETLALQALAWIAAEPERLSALMANTGLSPEALKREAQNPDFLGGILDYLLSDETQTLAFCAEMAIPPETPARFRIALPGGVIEGSNEMARL